MVNNINTVNYPGENGSITFQGGATFVDLCQYLSIECNPPCALKQVPSPLFVTVSGALATGTHGSGIKNKAIGAHVQDIEFVAADGKLLKYDRNVAKYHKGIQGGVTVCMYKKYILSSSFMYYIILYESYILVYHICH